jgi:hypothetical protein
MAAALCLLVPAAVRAQEAEPTTLPDPMQYNDPAMHFEAPDGFRLVGQRQIPLEALNDDLQTIAGWIDPKTGLRILIQAESFHGSAASFYDSLEQQLRGQLDSALFKSHDATTLSNGMPAVFAELTTGSGFTTYKLFMYVWCDGERGMVLAAAGGLGDIDSAKAKKLLAKATAVRYPNRR